MRDLYFLGTSALNVIPRKGCRCRLCEIARRDGKDKRKFAKVYFRQILIDAGDKP